MKSPYVPITSTIRSGRHFRASPFSYVVHDCDIGNLVTITFDLWYGDNQYLRLDTKIVFLTIPQVFRRNGISALGEATIRKFTGPKAADGL